MFSNRKNNESVAFWILLLALVCLNHAEEGNALYNSMYNYYYTIITGWLNSSFRKQDFFNFRLKCYCSLRADSSQARGTHHESLHAGYVTADQGTFHFSKLTVPKCLVILTVAAN